MIRPVAFTYNKQTAVDNHYQIEPEKSEKPFIQDNALEEFDAFVGVLRKNGVSVTVIEDTPSPSTPDSIFPNNWVSFHDNGETIVYPMFAPNRREEKRPEIYQELAKSGNLLITNVTDLSSLEEQDIFLEGTGSMILDRDHDIAYAAISERMHVTALHTFCKKFDYEPYAFNALQTVDGERLPIYHTNVMMCLGVSFAVVCLDCIDDPKERQGLIDRLESTGKEIVAISEHQVTNFAGNMLELRNNKGERLLVMSSSAYDTLNDVQKSRLEKHCRLVHSPLPTIEKNGGGSARCMMAEVFLPSRADVHASEDQ